MESTAQKQPASERMIVAYPLPLRPSRYRSVLHAARETAPAAPQPVNVYRLGAEVISNQNAQESK